MTSCAEWTGVLLSTVLKECGVKGSATWFVAEGAEEVKGASSMPIAKAMDDCILAYGMNGEAVRPQNGFPLRLMVPGFEGIFQDVVKRSALDYIEVESAWSCSKMLSDGFGGSATLITAGDIEHMSTSDFLEQAIAKLPIGAPPG